MRSYQAGEYYGCKGVQEFLDFICGHGKVFINANHWIAAMNKYDFYIGSRIHGVIATLLSGTPACLLTHDSRTQELAEFASIPSFPLDEVGALNMYVIENMYNKIDFSNFQNTRIQLIIWLDNR